jgi:alpha-tubulin suppressor-like RCC1 family protein
MLGEGNWAVGLPTRVAPDLSVVSVAIGYWHICVSTADQHTYCWGSNQEGQLGSTSNPRGWYVPMPAWAPGG